MNVKIGELVEYVEVLKESHKRKVAHRETVIQDLLNVKEELEKECDGQAQLIDDLQKQVKVAGEVALQAANDARKEIGNILRHRYGWSDEGLKNIGVL